MRNYCEGEMLCDLAEACESAGFPFVTIDQYLSDHRDKPGLLISEEGRGREYLNQRLRPAVCTSLESPIINTRFAHFLKRRAGVFPYLFTWKGMGDRLHGSPTNFSPIVWPNTLRAIVGTIPWSERPALLTLVANNKSALTWNLPPLSAGTGVFAKSLLKGLLTQYIKAVDPWMKSNLYLTRQNIVCHFGGREGFHLYGQRWGDLARSLGGGPKEKLSILAESRFVLCLENTAFPGYITEKLFDALFAGAIPLYLGAPDVTDWVPAACFIDLRKFSSFNELDNYIRTMALTEAQGYLQAARRFIESPQFNVCTSRHYVTSVLAALKDVAAKLPTPS